MSTSPTYSLNAKRGPLKKGELLHLLRRCLFGVGHEELAFFSGKTLEQCLQTLLQPSAIPLPPIAEKADTLDPLISIGNTWINAPFEGKEINYMRKLTLRMWWTGIIINRDFSVTEKMTLFLHNHFVTEFDVVNDSRYSYSYVAMLRAHSLGNFKKLIFEGTTNPAMLVYLNGNTNTKDAPNENYARELFELFTLGKTKDVHYTEDDVKAAARILTGWLDDKNLISSKFIPSLHDEKDKHFSAYFDNHIVAGKGGHQGGIQELEELVHLIFKRVEAAKFFCRNLYRTFVYSKVDEKIESEIITPLANIFINNNFEIRPVLETLLSSEHFFDKAFRGCIVKCPVDFLIGATQQITVRLQNFGEQESTDLRKNHEVWLDFHTHLEYLSQRIGDPPSVAGWPAYYQAPKYHQWWINSASLGLKSKLMSGLTTKKGLEFNGTFVCLNLLSFAKRFANHDHLDTFIEECLFMLLAVEVSLSTKEKLKTILLSGQKYAGYWKEAWANFDNNPNDITAREILETRLTLFFNHIFALPEYNVI